MVKFEDMRDIKINNMVMLFVLVSTASVLIHSKSPLYIYIYIEREREIDKQGNPRRRRDLLRNKVDAKTYRFK